MADTPQPAAIAIAAAPPRATWKDWLPVFSMMILVAGLLVTSGKMLGQLEDNTRRIAQLEETARTRDEQLKVLEIRSAGMDAKLDILLLRTPGAKR